MRKCTGSSNLPLSATMDKGLKEKIIKICDEKISQKGDSVGLSFYAFFENKNLNPDLLMQIAKWWIYEQKLDHFEKAVKIKKMIKNS